MEVIVFRFFGGALDGKAIRSDQAKGRQNEAVTFWKMTWNGTVGRRFDVSAPDKPAYQRYQVTSKSNIGDEVHVNCEHVG